MKVTETQPLVSVLVPLYNHARYVEHCLDSIMEDGYPRIEIIIIDDGSKDDSLALAQKWCNEKAPSFFERFLIESRPNKGVTRTLNELVAKSSGDYLVLLASDDFLLKGGIGARLDYLQNHPDKLAVFGDCIVVDGNGFKTHDSAIVDLHEGHKECLQKDELIALELIYKWCATGPGFMARRGMYTQIGFYDEKLIVEDWDMYLRLAASGSLGFITESVAAYRYHGENSVLNANTRVALVDSLKRTTLKNYSSFKGVLRLGLIYQYFKLKEEIALLQESRFRAYLNRKICKLLSPLSFKRYKKIVNNLK